MGLAEALAVIGLIALIVFVILAIFSIVAIYNAIMFMKDTNKTLSVFSVTLTDTINQLRNDVSEIKIKVIDTMNEVDKLAIHADSLTQRVESDINGVFDTVNSYKHLFSMAYNKIAPPIMTVSNVVSGVSKFIGAFSGALFKRK